MKRFLFLFFFMVSFLEAQEVGREVSESKPKEDISQNPEVIKIRETLENFLYQIEGAGREARAQGVKDLSKAVKRAQDCLPLYLKCVKEANYSNKIEDQKKYKEWEKKNRKVFVTTYFIRTLQIQIEWLLFLLKYDYSNLEEFPVVPAVAKMKTYYSDRELLLKHGKSLRKDVYQTIFAKRYSFKKPKNAKSIPLYPLDYNTLYHRIIIPKAIKRQNPDLVKEAWKDVVKIEEILFEVNAELKKQQNSQKKDSSSSASTLESTFKTSRLPALAWRMNEDLFKAGDKVNALKSMMLLLQQEQNILKKLKLAKKLIAYTKTK